LLYPLECGEEKNDIDKDIEIKETDEPRDGNDKRIAKDNIRPNENELNEGKDKSIHETQKRQSRQRTALDARDRIFGITLKDN